MPGLQPEQHVIAFRKREHPDLQQQLERFLPNKYASTGIISVNTRSLHDGKHSFPFLKTLRRHMPISSNDVQERIGPFCATSDNEFGHVKNCDLVTDFRATSEPSDYRAIERCKTLREKLNWLRLTDMCCDLIVECGSQARKFPAHCGVLADGSELCAELIAKACKTTHVTQRHSTTNISCKNETNIDLRDASVCKALVPKYKLPWKDIGEDNQSMRTVSNDVHYQPQCHERRLLVDESISQCISSRCLRLGKCLTIPGSVIAIPHKQSCPINSKNSDGYKSEPNAGRRTLRAQSALIVGSPRDVERDTSTESALSLGTVQTIVAKRGTMSFHDGDYLQNCAVTHSKLPTPIPVIDCLQGRKGSFVRQCSNVVITLDTEPNENNESSSESGSVARIERTNVFPVNDHEPPQAKQTDGVTKATSAPLQSSPTTCNFVIIRNTVMTDRPINESRKASHAPFNECSAAPDVIIHQYSELGENSLGAQMADDEEKIAICLDGFEDTVIFELMLDYIYTGRFDRLKSFPVKRLDEVQHAADVLRLNVDVYSKEVISQAVATNNLVQLWDMAENRKDEVIKKAVFEFASEHLTEPWMVNILLSQSSHRKVEFIAFTRGQMKCLRSNVLRAVVAWTNKSPGDRKRCLPAILPAFASKEGKKDPVQDFLEKDSFTELLSPTLLTHLRGRLLLRNKSVCVEEPVCQAAIPGCNFCFRKANPPRKTIGCNLSSRPIHRQISRILLEKKPPPVSQPIQLQMIASEAITPDALRKFDRAVEKKYVPGRLYCSPQSKPTTEEKTSDVPSIAVLGELIPKKTLFMIKYDHQGQVWAEADLHPRLTEETRGLTLASFHEFMIIAGGKIGFMPVAKPLTNWKKPNESLVSAWEMKLPLMNSPRRCFKIFLVGSVLYVCGGETYPQGYLGDVESLNISTQESYWNKLSSMLYKRAGHSVACTDDGFVFVVGGGTNRCEAFDVATMKWSEIAALPWKFMHCDVEVFVVEGEVVAMSCFQPLCLYILDRDQRSWQLRRLMGRPPGEVISTTVCGGTVYALTAKRFVMFFKMAEKVWRKFCKIVRPNFRPLFLCSWEIKN